MPEKSDNIFSNNNINSNVIIIDDDDVSNASKSCYPLASVEFVMQLGMKLSFKKAPN